MTDTFRHWVFDLTERVLEGHDVDRDEALRLLSAEGPDVMELFNGANRIRAARAGEEVHLCSIVNVKSGRCSEDCGFCSQSVHFDSDVEDYPFLDDETISEHVALAKENGAEALGLVAAWRGLRPGRTLERVIEAIRKAKEDAADLHIDASLGLIEDEEIPAMLKEAGLTTYNHNLETSRRHFTSVCSSHDYEARIRTLELMGAAGVRRCSGGIFNMGEDDSDRVDLALTLRELGVEVIPLNFLNPMEGTPLSEQPLLRPLDCLKIIAMFRFVLPERQLMIAGGREVNLRELQPMMFFAGASHTMAGNYLTSGGRDASEDHAMLTDLGLNPTRSMAPESRRATMPKRGALPILSS